MAKPSTDQTLLKAVSLARKGELAAARNLYQSVLARFPANKRAKAGLAALGSVQMSKQTAPPILAELRSLKTQLDRGDLEAVVQNAETLLNNNEKNEVLWNIYGAALARLGAHQQAAHAFAQATNRAPDFTDAMFNLAKVYETLNDIELAIETYQRALATAPNNLRILHRLGSALVQRGDQDDACACFEQILSKDPDSFDALRSLGLLHRERQSYSEAVRCFERVMALNGDQLSVLKNMSSIPPGCLSPEQVLNIQDSLNRLKAKDINLADAMFVQAHLDRHLGDISRAFDGFCKANAEKMKTIEVADLARPKQRREAQLNFVRHWLPSPAQQTAEVQTLVILGPSRSGKTTLEKILQGSACVEGAYEKWRQRGPLRNIADMQLLADVPPQQPDPLTLADVFFKDEAVLIGQGKRVVTVTNPTFINHVANLNDLLPGVCFCSVQRNPVEIATEIFTTNYRRRNSHAYDPEALLDYLLWYSDMTAQVMGKVRGITLKFEDILTRPQWSVGEIETLLGHGLGLAELTPRGLYDVNPLTELFEQRFMKAG